MKIIIASHGSFSKGCKDTLSLILGSEMVNEIDTYSLISGENAGDYVKKLSETIDTEETYVVFSDLFGGSVYNAFSTYLTTENVHLISGTNINLLIEFILSTEEDIHKRINVSIQNAKEGIMEKQTTKSIEEDEDF